jgi:hypothetical protein
MPLPDEYKNLIPEEYRDNETLERFNDVGDVFKTVIEQQSMLGNTVGRFPGPDAGEAERKKWFDDNKDKLARHGLMLRPDFENPEQAPEFWRTLGSPEDTDGYENPEDLPTALGDDVEAGLRKAAHDANLTKAQYKKFVQNLARGLAQSHEQQREAIESQNAELKQEWGMAFSERADAAKKMHEELGLYPDRQFGELTPKEIKSLYGLYESMTGKGPQIARQGEQQPQRMTPDEARAQMAEIMRRIHDPESNLTQPEVQALLKKRNRIAVEELGYSDKLSDLRAG